MISLGSMLVRLTNPTTVRRIVHILYSLDAARLSRRLLAVVVIAGLVAGWLGTATTMLFRRAEFPDVSSYKKYPARFEHFLNEDLAARSTLLDAHARLHIEVLRDSPTARVWIGTRGMLFYNHGVDLPEDLIGPLALENAVRHWSELIRARSRWCGARGVRFLALVVPDKQSVYAEQLPPPIRHRRGNGALIRLVNEWREEPTVPALDLRNELRFARMTMATYRRFDTHWTPYGCWLAYHRTSEALGLTPREWRDMDLTNVDCSGGDAWRLLGLNDTPPEERYLSPRLSDTPSHCTKEGLELADGDRLSHLEPVTWTNAATNGPKIVLFCDSFAGELYQQLLAQHCSRLVVVPTYEMIESIIERERPDAVVCEFVERSIQATRPRMPDPRR
jgi:alginate O-acetyltransferase complex protein AlgJ